MHRLAAFDAHHICRAVDEPELVQLDVFVLPAAAAAPLARGPQAVAHALERGILFAVPALPDARARLYAWPALAAPEEQAKLREAYAENSCRYLGQPVEACAVR